MPDRYWVGGTANWDGTAGTKWSATSGGPGGVSVPTTADDVFFDASSTGTVTIASGNTGAKSINCTGFTGTIAGSATISVAGSITLVAGMSYTHNGTVTITGTCTLITAGKTFSNVNMNGVGITFTLGDALNLGAGTLTLTEGSFNTNSYSITAASMNGAGSAFKSVTLNASTITLSNQFGFGFSYGIPPASWNSGTSHIICTSTTASFLGGSRIFYDVSFTAISGTRTLSGVNTFNNLTLASASTASIGVLEITSNQVVNGAFTCSTTTATGRNVIRSSVLGTTVTITAAALNAANCDFRDITIAGGAANTAPTRAGDCGGNSGIVFPEAKTVYRVGSSSDWQGSNSWALTANGTGSNDNYPAPQDTIVFDNNSTFTGTMFMVAGNFGTLDCSSRTNTITLNPAGGTRFYGSVTLGSGVTSQSNIYSFSGRGVMTLTTAGRTLAGVTMEGPGGTLRLGDALNISGNVSHTRGTFDANNYNVTCSTFNSNNSNVRTITMGSGLWTLTGPGRSWDLRSISNLTFNRNTANILTTNITGNTQFSGNTLAYNKLTIGGASGTGQFLFEGVSSFTELDSIRTVAYSISLLNNLGTIGRWSIKGTPGNVVTFNSSSVGTRRTFTLTNPTSGIDYLSVRDIGELSNSRFYVGLNSINGGNNSNVYFTDTPVAVTTGNMMMLFH